MFHDGQPDRRRRRTPVAAWLISLGDGKFGLAGWRFMMIASDCQRSSGHHLLVLSDRPPRRRALAASRRASVAERRAGRRGTRGGRTFDFPLRRALTSRGSGRCRWCTSASLRPVCPAFFLPSIISGFKKTFGFSCRSSRSAHHRHPVHVRVGRHVSVVAARRPQARTRVARDHPDVAGRLGIPVALYCTARCW